MAKRKITGLSPSLLESEPSASTSAEVPPDRPIVQTVKVPPDIFVQLKTVGARQRRSSQDIILAALREYLERSA